MNDRGILLERYGKAVMEKHDALDRRINRTCFAQEAFVSARDDFYDHWDEDDDSVILAFFKKELGSAAKKKSIMECYADFMHKRIDEAELKDKNDNKE